MKIDKNSEMLILLIMKHLSKKQEAYTSYQISNSIELLTKPKCFGISISLYENLDNLEKQGYIEKVVATFDNKKKFAYMITRTGMMLVNANIQENLNV